MEHHQTEHIWVAVIMTFRKMVKLRGSGNELLYQMFYFSSFRLRDGHTMILWRSLFVKMDVFSTSAGPENVQKKIFISARYMRTNVQRPYKTALLWWCFTWTHPWLSLICSQNMISYVEHVNIVTVINFLNSRFRLLL